MKRIINKGNNDPAVNLAIEEYCVRNFDLSGNEYLLVYINKPSVIIGKHQNPFGEVNINFIEDSKIPLLRRISGGGTVYHDLGNINFSYIRKFSHNSINNYKEFTQPIIKLLRHLGANAALDKRNNILIDGKKVSGNAQFSNMKVMFSHGTLLFDSNLDLLRESLKTREQTIISRSIKSIRSSITNLNEHLSKQISIDEFIEMLVEYITRKNHETFLLSDTVWKKITELSESKYRNCGWNYDSCPEFIVKRESVIDNKKFYLEMTVHKGVVVDIKISDDRFIRVKEFEVLKGVRYKKDDIKNILEESLIDNKIISEFVKFIY